MHSMLHAKHLMHCQSTGTNAAEEQRISFCLNNYQRICNNSFFHLSIYEKKSFKEEKKDKLMILRTFGVKILSCKT